MKERIQRIFRYLSDVCGRIGYGGSLEVGQVMQVMEEEKEKREKARAARGEVRRVVLKKPGANGELGGASKIFRRIGNSLIGEIIDEKVVTANNSVVDSKDIKAVCVSCGVPAEEVRYSVYSDAPLCRICAKPFTLSNGEEGFVSESELKTLHRSYDTWEAFDKAKKGKI